jgi:hypothetical protein
MLALLFAQEDVMIDGFEPPACETLLYWQFGFWLLWMVLHVFAHVGVWRYLQAHAEAVPWKALRFWLPVQILALNFLWWVVVSSTQANAGGWLEKLGWISGIEIIVLNLPGMPLFLLLIGAGFANSSGWVVTSVLIGSVAVSWNLFLRWVEARALHRGPISLFD